MQDDKWEIARHADAVAVLVTQGPKVLGVRQLRRPIATTTWEIPAGLIEPGEAPAVAAARELAEETKLGGAVEHVISFYVSPGFTDEKVHLFKATDLGSVQAQADEDEADLVVEWRDARDVWRAVAAGREETSGVTLLALRHHLAQIGLEP